MVSTTPRTVSASSAPGPTTRPPAWRPVHDQGGPDVQHRPQDRRGRRRRRRARPRWLGARRRRVQELVLVLVVHDAAAAAGYGTPPSGARPAGGRGGPGAPGGRHVGANGKREQALSASVAAKVKAAALAKVSGGTVERVETDVDHGSPYEAHVRKADGTQLEVLVNESFQVTAVTTMGR